MDRRSDCHSTYEFFCLLQSVEHHQTDAPSPLVRGHEQARLESRQRPHRGREFLFEPRRPSSGSSPVLSTVMRAAYATTALLGQVGDQNVRSEPSAAGCREVRLPAWRWSPAVATLERGRCDGSAMQRALEAGGARASVGRARPLRRRRGLVTRAWSAGTGLTMLAVGVGIYLVGFVVVYRGYIQAIRSLPKPRPPFWRLRWLLVHGALRARSVARPWEGSARCSSEPGAPSDPSPDRRDVLSGPHLASGDEATAE